MDSEVVSAIALSFNTPADYIKIAFFFWPAGFPPFLLCVGLVEKSISWDIYHN